MEVISPDFIKDKRVLLRYDIDVALHPLEEFKLKAGLPTLKLCLENAKQVILMGHLDRPDGKVVESLRVAPIVEWFKSQGMEPEVLENLRFDPREEACDLEYAKELASMGDIYINEAFSSYRPAVSTTVLPTLLPHAAGLHFAEEVEVLTRVRNNPKKPFVVIMGGAKVKDKLPVIEVLAEKADVVLVGGKIASEIPITSTIVEHNVMVGKLNEAGTDIAPETTESWKNLIMRAKMIVWNGPLGKFEDLPAGRQGPKNDQSAAVARLILDSGAETIVGGGDTIALLGQLDLLDQFSFVSVGGGAMLKLLSEGTLATIEALT